MPREINYTPEQTKLIVDEYISDPNMTTVNYLAKTLGKSAKSIVGKLAREGVYRKEEYISKTGDKPETKTEIIDKIKEAVIDMLGDTPAFSGLEKSSKGALKELLDTIKQL
jgi:hypothetical protein